MESDFYIYLYIDPRTDKVFYVGKGRLERVNRHIMQARDYSNSSYSKKPIVTYIRDLWDQGLEPIVKMYAENITEEESFVIETNLIREFGRKDLGLGTLLNITDGGAGTVHHKHTEETKKKMSDAKRRK
jgi:uncharacterized protein